MAASILDLTALALSLFLDIAAVNLSLIMLHSASVYLRVRAIARPSCDYTVILFEVIVDNDSIVDSNGEFDQFSFLFVDFSLENRICYVDFDHAGDFLTLFLTESIGKRCSNEADTAIDR